MLKDVGWKGELLAISRKQSNESRAVHIKWFLADNSRLS